MASPLEMLRDEGGTRYVKQKPKGVILECLGCQQENEFGIGTDKGGWTLDGTDKHYMTESASFMCRFCFGPMRETTYVLSEGGKPGGTAIVNYARPFRCMVSPCKCCCFQEISATDASSGQSIGAVKESCWWCMPNFNVYDASGEHIYDVHQPTCCMGLCVNCFDNGGAGCCKVPFYMYPPKGTEEQRNGKIIKVWLGMKKECCTLANTFEVEPPKGAEGAQLALTYATALLIDMNFFEGGRGQN